MGVDSSALDAVGPVGIHFANRNASGPAVR
jgi:hypothetical protein